MPVACPSLHRLQAVDNHVGDDLRQLIAVARDFGQVGFEIELDLNVFHAYLVAEQIERGVDKAVEVDAFAFRRFAPRQREKAFDNARATVGCLENLFRARDDLVSGEPSISNVDWPTTTDNGLFNSCATPARRPPSAAIFSVCCKASCCRAICASACLRSVRS